MSHFIILDRLGPGFLQWSGEHDSAEDAFAAFADMMGEIDRDAYDVRPVTAEERAEWEAWQERGAPAAECPGR